jgi:hypothetical protein
MKSKLIIGVALFACLTGEAMAACSGTAVTACKQLSSLLSGRTVCGRPGAAYPGSVNDRWQEAHSDPGGCSFSGSTGSTGTANVTDYKAGPSSTVDPSESVGSWQVSAGTIVYNYGSGGTYTYKVWNNGGGVYTFCAGTSEIARFTIIASGPCASYPP